MPRCYIYGYIFEKGAKSAELSLIPWLDREKKINCSDFYSLKIEIKSLKRRNAQPET